MPTYTELKSLLLELIDAWDTLEGPGYYSPDEIEGWLRDEMQPVVSKIRKHLKGE